MARISVLIASVALAIVAAGGAHAQGRPLTGDDLFPWKGWYVSLSGGISLQGDEQSTATDPDPEPGDPASFLVRQRFNTGFAAGAAIGFSWRITGTPWGLRFEGEYSYARNTVDTLSAMGQSINVNGALQRHSFIGNVYLDFNRGRWVPYVGAGLGLSVAHLTSRAPGVDEDGEENDRIDGSSVGFAVQALVGLDYKILPRWRLGVGYKYQATFNNRFEAVDGEDGSSLGKSDFGMVDSHTIFLKLSYLF